MEKETLNDLKIGQEAYIVSIECDEEALRSHILDMGLTKNTEVTLVEIAPLGDPLEIRIRGYNLTLRKDDASKIIIRDIHEKHECKTKNKIFEDLAHSMLGEKENYLNRKKRTKPKKEIKIALVGNQNCGKTTLFNQLTGSNQHVGNFPGVTVDKKEGIIKQNKKTTIVDLPGIYSLSPYTSEEVVTRNFILKEKPDGIINIIDATNMERNLYLTMQLIELDIPMVIALNMMDEVQNSGESIDINGLENILGVPVVPVMASKNEGTVELTEHIINVAQYEDKPKRLDFCVNDDSKIGSVHRCIHAIIHNIENHAKNLNLPVRFCATKIIEKDELINEYLALDEDDIEVCNQLIKTMEDETGLDNKTLLCDMRYSYIENLCQNFVSKKDESKEYILSKNIDKVLTGKYSAILSFFIIIGIIFYLTFGPVGTYLSDLTQNLIQYCIDLIDKGLTSYGLNTVFKSLIVNGVLNGIGAVLGFLPIIVMLFFFLSILEDTGYMARVAFVMDKLLRKIGLSGRSFVPMLIGFGCSVPAIMATRTLPSNRDRKVTIMLAPFMSCSAKLPIYVLFTSAFFIRHQAMVIVGLYSIGVIVGICFAYFLKIFIFKDSPVPFVMEIPNYRFPNIKNVYRLIYYKSKGFITKAFTIIFLASIVVWFLENFDIHLNIASNPSDSLLAIFGNFIIPIFKPLGIDDYRITTAFLTGFMAKESVVSTLSLLVGGSNNLHLMFSNITAFVFLIFSLLYTPCVATIATVKKELGKRYAITVVLLQCLIAWCVSFIAYRLLILIY